MKARLSLHTADMVTTMSALAFYGGLAGVQYERIRRLVEEFHRAGLFYLRSALLLYICMRRRSEIRHATESPLPVMPPSVCEEWYL